MPERKPKKQIDKFKEAARELEADDSEEAFDAKLRRIAGSTKSDGRKRNSDKDQ
ncbi:hypothetical protein [Mesorhizobium sp. SP-1A]|uniref:hypothetical protein n=1 Tax=Mesorhizobium sp. SP-1A TaxID=3077840 RepID=UPI0028F6E9A3|nr:hypothetical protein [Mesorhizobium sp. SP-1A]